MALPVTIKIELNVWFLSSTTLDNIICDYVAANELGYVTKDDMKQVTEPCYKQLNKLIRDMNAEL